MSREYWYRQTVDKPLFPKLHWSQPENRNQAGKLLVVGGNVHGFVAPAEAFKASQAAGIGTVHMILPDSLRPFIGPVFTSGELAPSTPSGSFSQESLAMILEAATDWADGVLLAGDLGKNSETAIMLESFIGKYHGQVTLTGDSLDYFIHTPESLFSRKETILIPGLRQLQQLFGNLRLGQNVTSNLDLLHFVEVLHDLTQIYESTIITAFSENICVASKGRISTTKVIQSHPSDIKLAAYCTTWQIQHIDIFGALTTAAREVLLADRQSNA